MTFTSLALAAPTTPNLKTQLDEAQAKIYDLQDCATVTADETRLAGEEDQNPVYLYNADCLTSKVTAMRDLVNTVDAKLNLELNKILDTCVAATKTKDKTVCLMEPVKVEISAFLTHLDGMRSARK